MWWVFRIQHSLNLLIWKQQSKSTPTYKIILRGVLSSLSILKCTVSFIMNCHLLWFFNHLETHLQLVKLPARWQYSLSYPPSLSVLKAGSFGCFAVWGRTSQYVCLKRPPQWHSNGKSMRLKVWAKENVGWWTLGLSPGQLGRMHNAHTPAEIDAGFVWKAHKAAWTTAAALCANNLKRHVKSPAINWGNNDPFISSIGVGASPWPSQCRWLNEEVNVM